MKGDGISLMKKITSRILVILVVAAMVLALPLTVVADDPAPETPVVEAEAPEAEAPEAEAPEAEASEAEAPEAEASEAPEAEAPEAEADEPDGDYATEDYPADESLEEAEVEVRALEAIAPFSAELDFLVDVLQELVDEINWAIAVIYTTGPDSFTAEQWYAFENNVTVWNDMLDAAFIEVNGQQVASGLDEVLDWLQANWDYLPPAFQQEMLALLEASAVNMIDVLRPAFFTYLYILCDWPAVDDCACILCVECEHGVITAICEICLHSPQPPGPPEPPEPPEPPPIVCTCEECEICYFMGCCIYCTCEYCGCADRVIPPPGGGEPAPGPVVIAAPQTGDAVQASLPLAALVLSSSVFLGGGLLKKRPK